MWYEEYLQLDDEATDRSDDRICAAEITGETSPRTITYRELAQKSKRLALQLLQQGSSSSPGTVIGVMMDPGIDLLVGFHAIWLIGCSYLSIDPTYPTDRLRHMIEDSGMKLIITEERYIIDISLLGSLISDGLTRILIEDTLRLPNSAKNHQGVSTFDKIPVPVPNLTATDVAYVIYTSGSTGRAKGVACTHAGLANLCQASVSNKCLNHKTIHLQFASTSFDTSVGEMFPTLYGKGKLVFAGKEQKLPGSRLAHLIQSHSITDASFAPSILGMMNEFSKSLPSLQRIVLAGEPCPSNLVKTWSCPGRLLVNEYGLTEATVCSTSYEIPFPFQQGEGKIPIGKPLDGVRVYVVHEMTREKCPVGVAGEMVIGGLGLAKGYINTPELTSQRFTFLPAVNDFCFLSGDRVVEGPDGFFYFLGRLDRQIKIRGFRVELEEIENTILQIPEVNTCAVTLNSAVGLNGMDDKILHAFVCRNEVKSSLEVSESMVKECIANKLPSYMVPSRVVFLERLPLMPNGVKVDRNALQFPNNGVTQTQGQSVCAINGGTHKDATGIVCKIFQKALGLPDGSIRVDDNFFDFGGDSLKVSHILMGIEKYLGEVLPSWAIYDNPTPISLASFVEFHGCNKLLSAGDYTKPYSILEEMYLKDDSAANTAHVTLGRMALPSGDDTKTILLTGSTGFLGAHLLGFLAKSRRVAKIYCIVRGSDDSEGLARLLQKFAKYGLIFPCESPCEIVVLSGDIKKEFLGLAESGYGELSAKVDTILHAAADISYIKSYSELHGVNVDGTVRLLQFGRTGPPHKTFHHISSLCIFGAELSILEIGEVDESYNIEQSLNILRFENGYTRSKWRAERMVEVARARGLPVNIYRPGVIGGDSKSGIGNESDLFSRLLIGCSQLGAYPDFPNRYWTALPVDNVAEIIGHIVCSGTMEMDKNYHLCPERFTEPSHNEIFEMVSGSLERFGGKKRLERWPIGKWLGGLKGVGSENALYPLVPYLTEKVFFGKRTTLEVHHKTALVLCNNTLHALEGIDIKFKDFSNDLMDLYITYLNAVN